MRAHHAASPSLTMNEGQMKTYSDKSSRRWQQSCFWPSSEQHFMNFAEGGVFIGHILAI
jgi:hypothetical protein